MVQPFLNNFRGSKIKREFAKWMDDPKKETDYSENILIIRVKLGAKKQYLHYTV